MLLSFIESPFTTRVEYERYCNLSPDEQAAAIAAVQSGTRLQWHPKRDGSGGSGGSASSALQYAGNNFDGAVLPGRPLEGRQLDGAAAMALAAATPAEPIPGQSRPKCDVLLFISSAAGYERRRATVRKTYLSLLAARPELGARVRYRFLLGAPKPEQVATLDAEQAEHGDLLQVTVPESYETLFPKVVAAWRWATSTHDFAFWMHADDDSYIRFDLLLAWLDSPAACGPVPASPWSGLYVGYIWDGSEGRRTKPLRDPTAKSYMPVEQWPHDSYPPFASGCGFLISRDLIEALNAQSHTFTFFRVIDVPIGVCLSRVVPPERLRVLHLETVRPYRPLPLFRADTLVQHYMQPEEFKQFHARALAAAAESAAGAKGGGGKDGASAGGGGGIPAEVYELFVKAKVMRR